MELAPHILARAKVGDLMFRVFPNRSEGCQLIGPCQILQQYSNSILATDFYPETGLSDMKYAYTLIFSVGSNYSYSPELFAIFIELFGQPHHYGANRDAR